MLKIDYAAFSFFSHFCLRWQKKKKTLTSLPAADFSSPKLANGS